MLHLQQYLTLEQQNEILKVCREVARQSPLFTPIMPSGKPFNCQMTSCGELGWISDTKGYRYSAIHPNGKPWTPIPEIINNLAKDLANQIGEPGYHPQTCLINYYQKSGKLGLHQDNSEKNLKPAIISISLGDDAIFLIGGNKRNAPTQEILLKSGDILILHGDSRLAFHGIKKIISGTSNLLKNGGRLNLTIRQVY
ncbi:MULTISPECIES: alpha-ketoglutarate-dependent dioxygenase AlkB [unclassified Dolichospermum]|uniref:alpha-ketoglutarate-dependent dioxygenase AlkB n=1 Tax=unclassified Dolichospermum TaxID=2622029 RepID=UPI0014475442|nr:MULTISPECIES: alpha-ketoglutarate-dependent dioxygenase AlkB [unclassified Dolichospermum]MTJ17467.1 alpha-ketoglutarate-dependent dioxygenase AlkB [Dolichospermum sp. UHCC 0299]MTJ41424.1 alpha-ketoglutarate-dependent dioxygenase AlkB [Dolichospermum sp. UHCC 0406]